jgi:hypothetical protein
MQTNEPGRQSVQPESAPAQTLDHGNRREKNGVSHQIRTNIDQNFHVHYLRLPGASPRPERLEEKG